MSLGPWWCCKGIKCKKMVDFLLTTTYSCQCMLSASICMWLLIYWYVQFELWRLHHAWSLVYVLQTKGLFWSFPYFDEIMANYFAYTIIELLIMRESSLGKMSWMRRKVITYHIASRWSYASVVGWPSNGVVCLNFRKWKR